MKKYDFNTQLTDEEFEDFGCDIIERRENIKLERFNKRKDLGIDGRFCYNNKSLIVQCKHFQNINNLIAALKTEELSKIEKLKPDRYILVLSTNPTVIQKEKIMTILSSYILSPNDIVSPSDILSYLREEKFRDIKKSFDEKLLADNINFEILLEKIKSPELENNSQLLQNEFFEIEKYFIKTKTYKTCLEYLYTNNIIFLSGEAGSGKSTNAKMLLNELQKQQKIEQAYTISNCEDILKIIPTTRKIGILFDDFWGSTFQEMKLSLNEERKLLHILKQLEQMKNIYLILTTREYVLKRGLNTFKDFENKNLAKRIMHKNCNYNDSEKAKILFAHIRNSNLSFEHLYILQSHVKDIIYTRNYSPRSINYFIETYQDTNLNEFDFLNKFIEYLQCPSDFLKSIFYKLSEGAQLLAFLLSLSNPEIQIIHLQKSFQILAKNTNYIRPSLFETYLKELFDNFLKFAYKNQNIVNFTNHSIFDFINQEWQEKAIDYEELFCKSVIYFNQIENLILNTPLTVENQNILITYLIHNFDSLIITNDLDIFLDASDDTLPKEYLHHKIWKSLLILKNIKNTNLKNFLEFRITKLIKDYSNKWHDYTDKNFQSIPEIVTSAEKLGITFPQEFVIMSYLSGISYLFELSYVTYFPKSYKEALKMYLELYGKKIKIHLESKLIYELEILSDEGITEEYLQTIECFPKILKMLKIPKSKNISKILEEYTIEFPTSDYDYFQKEESPPKNNAEIEAQKFTKELFIKPISKTKLIKKIRNSNLSQKNKTLLKKSEKEVYGIYNILEQSTEEFTLLILKFYEKSESTKKEVPFTMEIFPILLDNLHLSQNQLEFLKIYAHYIIQNSFNLLAEKHITQKYNIKEQDIQQLIKTGIIKKQNNLIHFGNVEFKIFLAAIYMKENYKTKKEYMNFCIRDGISHSNELKIMELFNAYNFNQIVFLPILDTIISEGFDQFKTNILNFQKMEDHVSINYSDDYVLLNDFASSFLGISIVENLNDSTSNEQEELCQNYYYFFKEIRNDIHKLKKKDAYVMN